MVISRDICAGFLLELASWIEVIRRNITYGFPFLDDEVLVSVISRRLILLDKCHEFVRPKLCTAKRFNETASRGRCDDTVCFSFSDSRHSAIGLYLRRFFLGPKTQTFDSKLCFQFRDNTSEGLYQPSSFAAQLAYGTRDRESVILSSPLNIRRFLRSRELFPQIRRIRGKPLTFSRILFRRRWVVSMIDRKLLLVEGIPAGAFPYQRAGLLRFGSAFPGLRRVPIIINCSVIGSIVGSLKRGGG